MRWFALTAIAGLWSLVNASMTQNVTARNIHSHNDYLRNLPFFDALAAGVTSFEADLHIVNAGDFVDLAVSHDWPGFRNHQSFKTVYLVSSSGLYDTSPSTSIQLLVDYKYDGFYLHPILIPYLESLRARKLLTTYDAVTETLTSRPITVVCSGKCRLEDVLAQQPRDIFWDAPLDNLGGFQYGPEVAPLASASLKKLFGSLGSQSLSEKTMHKIRPMLEHASMRGIKTRFYDTPVWPACVRNAVWKKLKQSGIYWMNVDDLKAGIKVEDDPELCIGINLCRLWLTFQVVLPTSVALWAIRWILGALKRVKLFRLMRRNQ